MRMKRALTGLLAVALIVTVFGSLTACGAKSKHELTVAVGYQFTTFDPALNTEVANSYILTHLYSGMFRKDPDGVLHNDLCESYEVSEDGLTYTFHMVPDALWSDGVPITAHDFE